MRQKIRIHRHNMLLVGELLFFFAFGICGCGQGNKPVQDTVLSGPLLSIDPATVGSISGTVTIESSGPLTNPPPPCVKRSVSGGTLSPDAGQQNSELAKTVVYLKAGLAKYRYQTPTDHVVLDQEGCAFEPQVIALMTNQSLEIRNSDPVAHNVHVLSKINKPWDHSEPAGAPPTIASFAKAELAVHVICKLHPGMSAYLFVFDHPYFAKPSRQGTFELKNIPPGTYTVEAWQEHLGTQEQTVTLGPSQSQTVSFVFKGQNPQGD